MTSNPALRIYAYGGPDAARIENVPTPSPAEGQVLVRVKAAGINPLDWKVRDGAMRDAFPLELPAILGMELAGEIVDANGSSRLRAADRVLGPVGGFGAYAGLVAVKEDLLCLTPSRMTDIEAAGLPVATLTAWQSLRAVDGILSGGRVLIHGAAGAVGGFAVQFAKEAGSVVLGTASGAGIQHVRDLGADVAIDYRSDRFEDRAKDIDPILDLVGGETLDRSWAVLTSGGTIVSTAAPDIANRAPEGWRGIFFNMQPDRERLHELANSVAAGRLRSTIAEVVTLAELPEALERNKRGHAFGKMIVNIV